MYLKFSLDNYLHEQQRNLCEIEPFAISVAISDDSVTLIIV